MIGLIFSLLIVGLLIGGLGSLVVPGRNRIGFWGTVGVGLIGALVGGFIAGVLGLSFLLAFIPKVGVAALLVSSISGRRRRHRHRLRF